MPPLELLPPPPAFGVRVRELPPEPSLGVDPREDDPGMPPPARMPSGVRNGFRETPDDGDGERRGARNDDELLLLPLDLRIDDEGARIGGAGDNDATDEGEGGVIMP